MSDIVERANVSRRTLYEHFDDKEACFLAAYEAGSELILDRLQAAQAEPAPWAERARLAVRAYLTAFAEHPAYAKATMIEVLGAGPRALARRREMHRRHAELLRRIHGQACDEEPAIPQIPEPLFVAAVAAVDGLVTAYIERDLTAELPALEDLVVYLERALLAGHEVAAVAVPNLNERPASPRR